MNVSSEDKTRETRIERAVKEEREACARLIEEIGYSHTTGLSQRIPNLFIDAAKRIRERTRG